MTYNCDVAFSGVINDLSSETAIQNFFIISCNFCNFPLCFKVSTLFIFIVLVTNKSDIKGVSLGKKKFKYSDENFVATSLTTNVSREVLVPVNQYGIPYCYPRLMKNEKC